MLACVKEKFHGGDCVYLQAEILDPGACNKILAAVQHGPDKAMREAGSDDWSSVSYIGLQRVLAIYNEGATKYGPNNWRKGLKFSDTWNHLMRHLINYMLRKQNSTSAIKGEDDLAKAAWGLLTLMDMEETHPEMDDFFLENPIESRLTQC